MASSDPRTATEEQWEDLIDKVKDKADLVDVPTIQMTTTDPGEGAPLADGHFIAVYGGSTQVGTSDIADGAVTTAKINNSAVTTDKINGSAVTTAKIADTNVTNGKIANGAVTGVANNATAIGTAKLALDTVGTPNLRDKAVTSAKIDFATLNFGNYSTSEKSTGFKWIDGKVIYKKTINFGTLPNAASKTVAHNISGLSKVIKIEGYAKNSSNVFQMMPYVPTSSGFLANIHANTTHIEVQSVGNLSAYTECYITLYYTKS